MAAHVYDQMLYSHVHRCKNLSLAPKLKKGKKKRDHEAQEYDLDETVDDVDNVIEYHRALIFKGLIMIAHRDALR